MVKTTTIKIKSIKNEAILMKVQYFILLLAISYFIL